MTWRDVRFATLRSDSGFSQGLNDKTPIWCAFHVKGYFRDIRNCHDIIKRLPRGWYTDIHADETAVGIVARISHGRFLAGYRWTSNDEYVIFPGVFDNEDDAAHAANGHAECFAESSREDSERFDRMSKAEIDADEALEALQDVRALRRMGRRDSDDVREAIEALREAREALQDATRAYEKGGR
jgi:hypothetical protein